MSTVPAFTLNNGYTIPALGIGTWKSKPGEVTQAVKDAIDVGYRHLDCAHIYGNEKEVGDAIKAKIEEGVVNRKDLYVVSKLWNTFHEPDQVEDACRVTLANLGLEYLDLYLIHSPMGFKTHSLTDPKFSDVDYVDTWLAMEKLVPSGLVRSIGISNFNKKQVERVLAEGNIKPVTNQVECHPYWAQERLSDFLKQHDILLTAYSPLGCPDSPWAKPEDPKLLDDTKLNSIAEKYKKTPAQVLLRYQLDRGHSVIPKSVSKSRIQENFDIFDFKLTEDDINYINSFNHRRIFILEIFFGHKYHPFQNDEY